VSDSAPDSDSLSELDSLDLFKAIGALSGRIGKYLVRTTHEPVADSVAAAAGAAAFSAALSSLDSVSVACAGIDGANGQHLASQAGANMRYSRRCQQQVQRRRPRRCPPCASSWLWSVELLGGSAGPETSGKRD
jgi:hypothetical protein